MAISKKTQTPSRLKNAILIIPIIAIFALIWLLSLKLEMLPESLSMNLDFDTWKNFWITILIILVVVLVCIPQSGGTSSGKEVSSTSEAPKATSTEDSKTKKAKRVSMVIIESDDKPLEFTPITEAEAEEKSSTSTGVVNAEGADVIKVEKEEIKAAEIIAPPVLKTKVKPEIIEYPPEVEGGIYGDTFIQFNDEKVLKLRTLVVRDIYLL